MMATLGLSNIQMGYVFGIFSISYGIFEIPMGYLVDRVGQRRILTRIVACWSVFTALTGAVWGYGWLLLLRLGFGAAEAGAFPAFARVIGNWFQVSDRGKAIGVMWMSARIGGALAPPVAMLLIEWIGWRMSFLVFAGVGALWCAVFRPYYRDDPLVVLVKCIARCERRIATQGRTDGTWVGVGQQGQMLVSTGQGRGERGSRETTSDGGESLEWS
jgi:MFS family permease